MGFNVLAVCQPFLVRIMRQPLQEQVIAQDKGQVNSDRVKGVNQSFHTNGFFERG